MRKPGSIVSAALAVLFQAGLAAAATIHVSNTGADTNTGTADAPFATIGAAVAAAADGDVVEIGGGQFLIPGEIVVDKAITLRGQGVEKTEIRLDSAQKASRVLRIDNAGATVSDVTVSGSRHQGSGRWLGVGVLIGENGGTLSHSRVTDNVAKSSDHHGGGVAVIGAQGLLDGCTIDGNTVNTGTGAKGGGVYLSAGRVRNCVIADNVAHAGGGVYVTGGVVEGCLITGNTLFHGARMVPGDGAGVNAVGGKVLNCTITKNSCAEEYGRAGGLYVDGAETRIVNCLIRGNRAASDPGGDPPDVACGATADPAQAFLHCAIPVALGVAPVTADPDFLDSEGGDYRLAAASPCIDAGTLVEGAPSAATDLAGTARQLGAAIDVGCYEADNSRPSCAISPERRELCRGSSVLLSPVLWQIEEADVSAYAWTVTGNGGTLTAASKTFAVAPAACGDYDVTLSVTCGGQTVTSTRQGLLHVAPADLYVDAASKTAAAPFETQETATPSLPAALEAAVDGSVIHVAAGHYYLPRTLLVEKGVRIEGAGQEETILDVSGSAPGLEARVLIVNHPDAYLSDMKLTGGRYALYAQAGRTGFGSGVKIGGRGGTIARCRITGNRARNYFQRGGGIALCGEKALLTHSVVDGNRNIYYSDTRECGGGVYIRAGLMENCLVYGNSSHFGGGICITGTGRVRNCTVTANEGEYRAGGIYWEDGGSEVVNCLFAGNKSGGDTSKGAPEWRAATENATQSAKIAAAFSHCAFTCKTATEESSILVDTPFIGPETQDYHLIPGSAPIDAGIAYDGIAETDLDGSIRVSGQAPDIGCYEADAEAFSCSFEAVQREFFVDEPCQLSATLENAPVGATFDYDWLFTDHLGNSFTIRGEQVDEPIPAGLYKVTLTLTGRAPSTATASITREQYLLVAPRTFYVATPADEPASAFPYDSPETAATDFFDVWDFVVDGSRIVFSEGTHLLSRSISIERPLVLEGKGIDKSILKRSASAPNDRVLYVNDEKASVDGFTITGGRLGLRSSFGTGVWIGELGGTVSRCRITGNKAVNYFNSGGGVGLTGAKARLSNSIIDDNNVLWYEVQQYAGGVYASAGIVENCLVYSNTAALGAGIVAEGTGLFRNCTVVRNRSTMPPSQAKNGLGGGVYLRKGGTIENTVFAFNTAVKGDTTPGGDEWTKYASVAAKDATSFVRCAWPATIPADDLISADSIHCDPLFVDAEALDFRLQPESPCRNAGHYEGDWATTDLGGGPRIVGKRIDIGAYECSVNPSTILLLR